MEDRITLTGQAGTVSIGIAVKCARYELDRDEATEPCIACAIHVAHPAAAERLDELVGSEVLSGFGSHDLYRFPGAYSRTANLGVPRLGEGRSGVKLCEILSIWAGFA